MKPMTKLLSLFLLLLLLLGTVACVAEQLPEDTTAETTTEAVTEETTEAGPVSFALTTSYLIIRPETADKQEILSIQLLSRAIKSAYGFDCRMTTDFTRKGEEVKPNEFEILVGATNRNESKALSVSLPYYDYSYEIVSENVIAICGGSYETTYAATVAFCRDILGYEEDAESGEVISAGSAATLTVGTSGLTKGEYPVTSLKIGERDFSEYSLVVTSETLSGINTIVGGFSRLCGRNLPVVPLEEYVSGPAIFFGCGSPDGEHYPATAYSGSRYYIFESGENIYIDFKTTSIAGRVADRFVKEYLPTDAKGSATIALRGENTPPITALLNITSGTNGLVLESETIEKIAEGVFYVEQLYLDKDGAPVRAYAVIVAPGAATIETAMPPKGVGSVTTVKNMLTNERAAGKNAIAAINADFFDMGGTNVMRGLCIKDGRVLHSIEDDRPWFAITKDGKPVMGLASEYKKYEGQLQSAVGGSHIVLKNDAASNLSIGTDFADTRHPRTAVGVTADGSIVLLVVDGRQTSISNGASLADLANILAILGCTDGINLDGGGSSTLVLSDEQGNVTVENSPSAGGLRSVANGLVVVLP